MTSSTGSFDAARRSGRAASGLWAALRGAAGWPGRVYRARQLMHQMGGLADHELRDIGLTRQDVADAGAFAFDTDPSLALRRRIEERRRWR